MSNLMMNFKNLMIKFCRQGVTDRANFIKNITVIGFALSGLAQVFSIYFNDKIPSKEKKFLIPQEIFDSLINSTIFYFITSKAVDFGKLLVLKKKILPKSISNIVKSFIPNGKDIATLKTEFLSHLQKNATAENVKFAKNFVDGMGVMTGIGGAILTNNIVTPVIRNKLAAVYQKNNLPTANINNPSFAKNNNFVQLTQAPQLSIFKSFYNKNI